MVSSVKGFMLLIWLMLSTAAYAMDCPVAVFNEGDVSHAYLWQHRFSDGTADLVMSLNMPEGNGEVRRVSYGGSKAAGCQYLALAIARGGNWGWHIVWSTERGVFYSRMDGEAWVSSPPKKIAANKAVRVSLKQTENQLRIEWIEQDSAAIGFAESSDEGRSW